MKLLKRAIKWMLSIPEIVLMRLPLGHDIARTAGTAAGVTFRCWFVQKCLGFNREAYWPMHLSSVVSNVHRIKIGIGTAPGLSPGCYIQGINGIEIGDYTVIAPNVGLISADHSLDDLTEHIRTEPIRIGRYCWIGMNAVVLPGVRLGDHTVVAAGAVVTESFPTGYCVVGGIPARLLKTLNASDAKEHRNTHEYLGYYSLAGTSKEDLFRRLGVAL